MPLNRKFRKQDVPLNERSPRARGFLKQRRKDKLRPALMGIDPHCSRCGMLLQDVDSSQAATFARVLLSDEKLFCLACVNAVDLERRLATKAKQFTESVL